MISIIIVNYRTYEMTKKTIEAALKSTLKIDMEIIVVDNDSGDGSLDKLKAHFKEVTLLKWIQNGHNDGFAKANNIGIKASHGDYILLLNSDVIVKADSIGLLLEKLEYDPRIGVIGPKIILTDGTLDHTCKRGFPTPMSSIYYFLKLHKRFPENEKFGHYTMSHLHEDSEGDVDALVGAFMLLPRRVIDQVGLLDEAFFMYGEDLDFCYRIKQQGYGVCYAPITTVVHYKGASSSKKSYKLIYEFQRAMWLFYKKHYKGGNFFMVNFLVFIGIYTQFMLKVIKNFVKGVCHD